MDTTNNETSAAAPAAATLRTVYTIAEFVAEILREKRSIKWVRSEIHRRRISVVARRPYLIPQCEAVKFLNGTRSTMR